jgi:hypothetical protein
VEAKFRHVIHPIFSMFSIIVKASKAVTVKEQNENY